MTADSFSSGRQSAQGATEQSASVSDDASRLTVDAPSVFSRMEDGGTAEWEAEERISEILGIKLLGISWDGYDGSFEIYPWEDVADIAPTAEQHAAILALGCSRYWINFPDGSQRYCTGQRQQTEGRRWERHNSYKDEKRRHEEAVRNLVTCARAVAFSNGFDAAYPDKLEALRAVLRTFQPRSEEASTGDALGSHAAEGTQQDSGTDDKSNPHPVAPKGKEAEQ